MTVSEEYNDNIYLDADGEVDDFITVVSPGFMTELRWQRSGIRGSYDLGYSMYENRSENDGFRHRADVATWWDVSQNTRFSLGDTFVMSEDQSYLELTDVGQTRRNTSYANSAHLDMDHRFGERRSLALGYAYETLENDDETLEDNQSHHANGTLNYFFSPWLGMESGIDYTRGLYDVTQDFDEWSGHIRLIRVYSRHLEFNAAYTHTLMAWEGDGAERDYQIYHPSVGISATFDNQTSLSVNAGYFVQDIEQADNEKGLAIDGNIGKSWTFRRGLVQVNGSSGYEESQLNTENLGFTVYYGADARGEYSFTRNLASTLDLGYRNNDYVNTSPERTDRILTGALGLSWQMMRRLSSRLEYRYRNLDSDIDINDYTENRIMLSLTLTAFDRSSSASP
ncbi:outer membrane beta-barrel protein [Desulfatiferula olefinivorans]